MNDLEPIATRREGWLLLAWALVLFAGCVALYSRQNDFPYYYHPDEPAKVAQVLTGEWNFHHPMLLLDGARMVVDLGHVPRDEQSVVGAGRWVSAGFVAVGVVALSLLAFGWRGWPAAFAAGLSLALSHQLFELAHYFKEDSALLAGLSLSFLMLLAVSWEPSLLRVALLGVACGLATSGKYLGVVAVVFAVPVLWQVGERRRLLLVVFAASLFATLLIVNLPLFLHLATFRQSFGREMEFVVKGQRGTTRSVPHTQYWNVFIDNTTPAIWLLVLVFLYARWRERRAVSLAQWVVIGFPFAYALALSFSPKSNDRYFLPATAVLTLLAALGAIDFSRFFIRRRPYCLWGAIITLVAMQEFALPGLLHWTTLAEYMAAFQTDNNAELIAWINAELPREAVLAKDSRILLPDPDRKKDAARMGQIPQKVIAARFVPDLGTIDELMARGITHVVVSESDYGRFTLKGLRPQEAERADFERRKVFYEQLLRDGKPLFERERGTVLYLHPGIRVYSLAQVEP